MYIEFVGLSGTGKTTSLLNLSRKIILPESRTRFLSHGKIIIGPSRLSLLDFDLTCAVKAIRLLFIIVPSIIAGPEKSYRIKFSMLKRSMFLAKHLSFSKKKFVFADEGFLQLFFASKLPSREPHWNYKELEICKLISKKIDYIVFKEMEPLTAFKGLRFRGDRISRFQTWREEVSMENLIFVKEAIEFISELKIANKFCYNTKLNDPKIVRIISDWLASHDIKT
jgi:hypothetical protein